MTVVSCQLVFKNEEVTSAVGKTIQENIRLIPNLFNEHFSIS